MRKLNRKLALSKETICTLDDIRLKKVAAAVPQPTATTCFASCLCNLTLQGCIVEDF